MRVKKGLLVLLILGSVSGAEAARLAPLWAFDRSYAPPPEFFLLTAMRAGGGQQQFHVVPNARGACTRLPQGTADDFCTELPCPPPGSIIAYWVQALWPEVTTGPVEVAVCWFQPGPQACVCQKPGAAPPAVVAQVPPSVPPPPLLQPPTGAPPLPPVPPSTLQPTPAGLDLQPIGELPPLSVIPAVPTAGGA